MNNKPIPTKITIVTASIQLLEAGAKVMQQAMEKHKRSKENKKANK